MKRCEIFIPLIGILMAACWQTTQSETATDDSLPSVIQPIHHLVGPGERPLHADTIPYTEHDLIAPGRGANTWYTYTQSVQIPVPGITTLALDNDTRFLWAKLQPAEAGVYVWDRFDQEINYAIEHGQKFSFGIMPVCSSCIIGGLGKDQEGNQDVDGFGLGYPLYLHRLMQSESVPDWKFSGGGNAQMWVPNWNSDQFLTAWETFLNALAKHIATGSYKGVSYSHVIYHIDVRGYGNWGEWHTYPWRDSGVIPADTRASDTTLIRIIAAHVKAFPDYPLISMVNTFNVSGDAGTATKSTAASVGYYALTVKNKWGPLGWRSDHLGSESTDKWVPYETHLNGYSHQGVALKELIKNRWKTAPIVGEPLGTLNEVNGNGTACAFYNLLNEIRMHHISQFSNENLVSGGVACSDSMYRAASKASGYRLQYTGGGIAADITPGKKFSLTLDWSNTGVAPIYETWNTILELRTKKGTVAWSGVSAFHPAFFLPGSKSVTDSLLLPSGLPAGEYSLHLVVRDPLGYRKPLPLANTGAAPDGSYLITMITIKPQQ